MPAAARRALAAAVLVALGLHAAYKLQRGLLGEMLWACHVASLLLAVGIVTGRSWLIASNTVFHLAVGVPAFLLDLVVLGLPPPTSALVHLLPPAAGLIALRGAAPWPRWTPIAGAGLYVALIPVCRLVTDPVMNVNVAFAPWPPLAAVIASPWAGWLFNLAWMAAVLPLVDRWARRWPSAPLWARPRARP